MSTEPFCVLPLSTESPCSSERVNIRRKMVDIRKDRIYFVVFLHHKTVLRYSGATFSSETKTKETFCASSNEYELLIRKRDSNWIMENVEDLVTWPFPVYRGRVCQMKARKGLFKCHGYRMMHAQAKLLALVKLLFEGFLKKYLKKTKRYKTYIYIINKCNIPQTEG